MNYTDTLYIFIIILIHFKVSWNCNSLLSFVLSQPHLPYPYEQRRSKSSVVCHFHIGSILELFRHAKLYSEIASKMSTASCIFSTVKSNHLDSE